MAGIDDLRALSAYIATLIPNSGFSEDDIEGVAAVAMNRATQFGSLGEAIESLDPPVDFVRYMQNEIKDSEKKSYKKSIQIASRFIRGSEDKTNGAFFYFPKGKTPSKELGLIKTYGTKNFSFFKQGVIAQTKPRRGKVSKLQSSPVQEATLPSPSDSGEVSEMQGSY